MMKPIYSTPVLTKFKPPSDESYKPDYWMDQYYGWKWAICHPELTKIWNVSRCKKICFHLFTESPHKEARKIWFHVWEDEPTATAWSLTKKCKKPRENLKFAYTMTATVYDTIKASIIPRLSELDNSISWGDEVHFPLWVEVEIVK